MKDIYDSIKDVLAKSINEQALPKPVSEPPKPRLQRAQVKNVANPRGVAANQPNQPKVGQVAEPKGAAANQPAQPRTGTVTSNVPKAANAPSVNPTVASTARSIASRALSVAGRVAGVTSLALEPSRLASGELPKEKRDELEKGQGKVDPSGRPLQRPYPAPYTNPPSKKAEPGKAEPAKEPAPAPKTAVSPAPKAVVNTAPKAAPVVPPAGNKPPSEPVQRRSPVVAPVDQNKEQDTNNKPQPAITDTDNVKPQPAAKPPASDQPKAVDKKEPEDDWVPSRRASDRPAPPPPPSAEAPKAEPKTVKPDWFVRTPGSPTKSGEAGYLTTKDREGEVYPGTDIPRSAVFSGSGAAERAAQIRGHSVDKYEVGMAGPRYQHKGKWYSADPTDAEMEQKKKSQTTKEETQMSINKRYGVSDELYSSVMEVLAKHKGTPPRHEKERKLAAMHGDPNTITHGDVLKARGVKMKEETKQVDEMSSKMKMKLGLYGKKKKTNEEAESIQEKNTDTPGNSYEHQCAIHVKNEEWGVGRTITTQHADPDESGNIAWYDVMFEHGIEKQVPTSSLEILVSESHMHSKRKKKGM